MIAEINKEITCLNTGKRKLSLLDILCSCNKTPQLVDLLLLYCKNLFNDKKLKRFSHLFLKNNYYYSYNLFNRWDIVGIMRISVDISFLKYRPYKYFAICNCFLNKYDEISLSDYCYFFVELLEYYQRIDDKENYTEAISLFNKKIFLRI